MGANVHHLELFYYVARHGGITAATKAMPFGIQQPAVSGQILQLEDNLGTKLFHRRPFALTPPGAQLYRFLEPFFSQLDTVISRIGEEEGSSLRLAASPSILSEHLPIVLADMRDALGTDLRLQLRETHARDLSDILLNQEADVAIAPRPRRRPTGVKAEELLVAPLVLLVPADSDWKKLTHLHDGMRFIVPLILPHPDDLAARLFRDGMAYAGLAYQAAVEVQTTDLVPSYVQRGFGVGLAVANPGVTDAKNLRQIPLPDIEGITIDAFYVGKPKPLVVDLITRARAYVNGLGKK